ncbi:MAG: hypothetical protein JWO10_1113 [Microbacteriaceae bacterium]|nr:hypothetical protein [Microbacteriaceae bacterium]
MVTSTSPLLLIEEDGPVRIITLNNPEMMNAMVDELHEALVDIFPPLSRDPGAKVIVITGAGKAFSAGGSLPSFIAQQTDLELRRRNMRTARMLVDHALACHLPIIAAVNGPAVGLGCSIAGLSDLVLMADNAYFADPHVSIGLVAGDGGVVSWPFMMSMLKVKEYIFTGDRIPAEKAVELGLANRVVPAADLMEEAMKLAHKLAAQPAQALQESKRALNLHLQQAALLTVPFALTAESESFTTQDSKDAVAKFQARADAKAAESK